MQELPEIRFISCFETFRETKSGALHNLVLGYTLKIACRVRRWRSVKTKRGFLGAEACSAASITSFLLHAETEIGL